MTRYLVQQIKLTSEGRSLNIRVELTDDYWPDVELGVECDDCVSNANLKRFKLIKICRNNPISSKPLTTRTKSLGIFAQLTSRLPKVHPHQFSRC